ncbi:MAG: helix-turn-helix domain-containing protein [Deltaproteobacteria bacterium]|nr:helix-turn-helix domain-containing protein [Deltaproteobacteria bacterium]
MSENSSQSVKPTSSQRLIDLQQLARRFGICRDTARMLVLSRQITGHKIGGCWRFRQEDIDEYLARHRQEAEYASNR